MIRTKIYTLSLIAVFWFASTGNAQEVTACDELANHPSDPAKVTPGVAQEDVDTTAAKQACAEALASDPTNGRFLYQYGRAHFYEADYENGPRIIRQSADTGYAQGQFVYGLILAGGYIGDVDFCEVGRWWQLAADQGHFWAQVYFIDNALEGIFEDCPTNTETETLIQYMINIRTNYADKRFDDPRRADAVERLGVLINDLASGSD